MSTDPRMYPQGAGQLTDPFTGNVVRELRQRYTTAQINAGVTLLPALPGVKWQVLDGDALAVGGAASGLTTLDVVGTLAAATRKLIAFGQAALTQSTRLRAGASGATILADGASFTANDANTAVTLSVTGSALATSTAVDVFLRYVPVLA